MATNPLYIPCRDPAVGAPLIELKMHLLLFVDAPPGPVIARRVWDLYLRRWGDPFRLYKSTSVGALVKPWSAAARRSFEQIELPDLRRHEDWGYGFADERYSDSWMYMFHGYRPVSEAGKASFYRFEFDWQVDLDRLLSFTADVLRIVDVVSGYGGYFFQGLPNGPYARTYFDQAYAWGWRYWGVEVEDLDVSVDHMLEGYKCPSWITIIGEALKNKDASAVRRAEAAAFRAGHVASNTVLLAGPSPALGDRHLQTPLTYYEAIARALEPLQVRQHGSFGGSRWTDANTMAWLRRFSGP